MAESRRISSLGRYELLAPIETGAGVGQLHLARLRGAAGFEKLVVVQVFDRAAPGLVEEARRAAAIKHPNVIDIHDVGEDLGRSFVAVDELEGASLRTVIDHGLATGPRIDELDAARVIATAAEALDAAHELRRATGEPAGFAHGHVTADSVVVLYNGQVKLGDFGVRSPRALATTAPERLGGGPAERRADYFSLGAVMWEALTHEPLFAGADDAAIARAIEALEVRPPSSVNANVPVAFDAIVARALARDPAARYATGAELANDIEDVLGEARYPRRNERIARYMTAAFAERIAARREVMSDLAADRVPSAAVMAKAYGAPAAVAAAVGRTTTTVASVPPPIATPSPLVPAPPILPPSATQVGRAIAEPLAGKPADKPAEKPAVFATTTMGRPVAEPEPVTPVEPPAGTFVALAPVAAKDAETIELPTVEPAAVAAAAAAPAPPAADPVAVVSLPKRPGGRADTTGEHDVLGTWGWQSGSHAALSDDGDDDYEVEGKRRRRTLIYATGGGVALAAIVAVIALAFGGGKNPAKSKAQIAASAEDPAAAVAPLPTEVAQTQPDTPPPPDPALAAATAVIDAAPAIDAAPVVDQAALDRAAAERAEAERAAADKAAADKAAADKAAADKAAADKAVADKAAADKAAADKAAADKAAAARVAAEKAAADKAAAEARAEAKARDKDKDPAKSHSSSKRSKPATTAAPIDPYAAEAAAAAPPKTSAAEAELAYRSGVQLFARGDAASALTALKTSQAGNPGHAPTQRALGLVYEKLGRPDLAKASFKRYLKLAPKAQDAAIIRARMEKL